MRDDMFKVIVERPRWGARYAASPKLKNMADAEAKHIGLKRHAFIGARNTKMLNETSRHCGVTCIASVGAAGTPCSARFAPTSTPAARSKCTCASISRTSF